jgi:hypothetical protein
MKHKEKNKKGELNFETFGTKKTTINKRFRQNKTI